MVNNMQSSIVFNHDDATITITAGKKELVLSETGITSHFKRSEFERLADTMLDYSIIRPIAAVSYFCLILVAFLRLRSN